MNAPWHERPLVCFDLETSGIDTETARLVTAAVVRCGGGQPTDSRSWLSDAGGTEIPAEAAAVHGITTETARTEGQPAAAVVDEITTALADAVNAGHPIVAMNATYDLTLLDREARRWNITPLTDRVSPHVLDPKVIDKHVDRYRRGRRTLSDLCKHYAVPLDAAHSADADAIAAGRVTWRLATRYQQLAEMTLPEIHQAQTEWAAEQAAGLRDHFARTRGKEHLAAGVRLDWPLIPAQSKRNPR